ncbi:MAG: DUF3047 domain-containing protein [Lentisphaeraceae bacterium]|nr:DUF3047 domain-containing protein [Lentisphaeraceae bacterium]
MNSFPATLLLITLFSGTACAEPEKIDVKVEQKENVENVISETVPTTKSTVDSSIVVDYKDFPKNSAGEEVWTKKVKTGKADVKVVKDADLKTNVLNLKSDEASYYYQKSLEDKNFEKHDIVSWKWKVRQNPKGGDVRKGSTDDQAIQVLLAFEGKYIISYIWDPTAPVGHSKDSSIPFLVAQKILVLESGDKNLDKWVDIRRNYKEDFKKLYKKDAPKLVGVAVQINSQHTDSKCESFLSPITFLEK